MNELVDLINQKMGYNKTKIKLPYFIGLMAGYCFDILSYISGKKYMVSSVRIKKFCATTQFSSEKAMNLFNPPYSINEGLNNTIEHEFLNPRDDNILFYSE